MVMAIFTPGKCRFAKCESGNGQEDSQPSNWLPMQIGGDQANTIQNLTSFCFAPLALLPINSRKLASCPPIFLKIPKLVGNHLIPKLLTCLPLARFRNRAIRTEVYFPRWCFRYAEARAQYENMSLTLSVAVRLGSLLVPHPEAGNVERCAITMALKAIGALPENLDDCGAYCAGQWNALAYPGRTLRDAYPWIKGKFRCGWCERQLSGENIVWHPFDDHVMGGRYIPFGAFCDWLHIIDPTIDPTNVRTEARSVLPQRCLNLMLALNGDRHGSPSLPF
jgi:hypothetical protein